MKSVTFQEESNLSVVVCELIPRSQLSREDRENTWFSKSDYIAMKDYDRLIAEELRRSGRARLLEGSLQDINEKHNVGDVDIVQQMLIHWSRLGGSCRGLERWIHVSEGKKRKREQRCSIKVVLETQELEKESPMDMRANRLRDVSEEHTARARAFASKMGVADAAANFLDLEQSSRALYFSWNRNSSTDSMLNRRMPTQKVINCSRMA